MSVISSFAVVEGVVICLAALVIVPRHMYHAWKDYRDRTRRLAAESYQPDNTGPYR